MGAEDLRRVGDILIEEGMVTHDDVVRLVAESGLKGTALAALLEQAHHVGRSDLAAFLAGDFVIPRIEDLRKFDLYDEAARLVPEAMARKHEIVPLARMGDLLCVARPTYFNKAGILELRRLTGLRVKVFQADEDQVLAALDRIYGKRSVEIPPPKSEGRMDTHLRRATPPPVQEEVADAIPLIARPDEEPGESAASPVDALKVEHAEFALGEQDSSGQWLREFEDTFLHSRPLNAIRMA